MKKIDIGDNLAFTIIVVAFCLMIIAIVIFK